MKAYIERTFHLFYYMIIILKGTMNEKLEITNDFIEIEMSEVPSRIY